MQPDTSHRFAAQLPKNLGANIAYFLVKIRNGILLVLHPVQTLGKCIRHTRISGFYRSSPINPKYKGSMEGIFPKIFGLIPDFLRISVSALRGEAF